MVVPYHVMARDTTIAKLDNPLFELYTIGLYLPIKNKFIV